METHLSTCMGKYIAKLKLTCMCIQNIIALSFTTNELFRGWVENQANMPFFLCLNIVAMATVLTWISRKLLNIFEIFFYQSSSFVKGYIW